MPTNPDTGAGASVTDSAGFTGSYREIGEVDQEIEVVDTTTLNVASDDEATNIAGDNPSPGQIRFRTQFNALQTLPVLRTNRTLTITLPKTVSGSAAAATLAGTGYFVRRRMIPNLQRNQLNEGELVFQFDGLTGPTYTAEA